MNLENINYYSKEYNKKGYFVIKNVIKKNFIKKILNEIYQAKNVDKYKDSQGNLRRIERLYNKGKSLKSLNLKILGLLDKIFQEKFVIFKDKFNAKPPGGDGFYAHFDGIFNFVNQNNEKKKAGMNTQTFLLMF